MNVLTLNPFLEVNRSDNAIDSDFLITAPNRLEGLSSVIISKTHEPGLHELFADLVEIGIDSLDADIDLNEAERQLFLDRGILVRGDKVPEKALFSCLLEGVPSRTLPTDDELFVAPTFRFKSVDFKRLVTTLGSEHLSGRPSAWITEEATGIERGYWFDKLADAEIVSKFEAGKPLPFEIEPDFLGKLYAAGIVTTLQDVEDRARRNQAKLEVARERFQQDRYAVIEDLLPTEQMEAMRTYYRKYVSNGFMPFDDTQAKRFYQHNEPLATVFHKQLTRIVSHIVGEEVIPSYVYAGSYVEYADLHPHTDRPQCEFSISFQVDYLPEQAEHRSPWGLFLWNPEWGKGEPVNYDSKDFPAATEADDPNVAVYLRSGDGLIYKGRELIHYRYPLASGHRSTSLFFHYVSKDFAGELR